ncbi:MAG: aminoacyl-tRNA hydrolase [Candidatus Aminicenantes bacterium]
MVGLGNPGKQYARTRHNVGFLFVRNVAKAWGVRLRKSSFSSKTKWTDRGGERILLATPQTYMNNSGLAVHQIVASGRFDLENLVIVYDDLDIPLGDIRIRKEGGAGTHKGMSSIVQALDSVLFPRIRIGIGPLPPDMDATDFVLSSFFDEEKPFLEQGLSRARKALDLILEGRIEVAMNLYNQRTQSDQEK